MYQGKSSYKSTPTVGAPNEKIGARRNPHPSNFNPKKKLVEDSSKEEATESKSFEKKEDK
jgi:hypothetical protein